MRDIKNLKIEANKVEEYQLDGDYVRLADNMPTVYIEAVRLDGTRSEQVELKAGDSVKFDGKYSRLRISHGEPTEQAIAITIGEGLLVTSRFSGAVNVTGGMVQPVGGGDNTAAPPYVRFQSAQDVKNTPITPTNGAVLYTRNTASALLNTIVTPAANVNGLIIYSALVNPGVDAQSVMYKQSAPVSWFDGGVIVSGEGVAAMRINNELMIPAGYGLYEQANGTTSNTRCSVIYKLL